MWQRNNGQAEDDLQFRFTAYLVSAVKRRRKDYLIQFYKVGGQAVLGRQT